MAGDSAELEARLQAAEKTIAALMRRVEKKVAGDSSAFAVLEQSIALERVVADRTAALVAKQAELEETLARLQRAQHELVQAQKLEAVGRLAAGIAHEINTPVQYVGDSVTFVQEGLTDVLELLRQHRTRSLVDAASIAALERMADEIDLPDLIEQMPKALARARAGLEQVANLVRAVKEFAHPDRREKESADLNRALLSTLDIARHEYKDVAGIETDLQELPRVPCYLSELNQVFLNLIINAAHAIESAQQRSDRQGVIRVQTRFDKGAACISIGDNGTGIPEAIRDRIYDPFFTTKEVGKGTGQGLAIAHNIVVEKHGGTLTFESEVDRGTTFVIRLPLA